jgi:hypothetical protein
MNFTYLSVTRAQTTISLLNTASPTESVLCCIRPCLRIQPHLCYNFLDAVHP